jgi:KaiC/GvpD/RAD55 family RecA-like ATPase
MTSARVPTGSDALDEAIQGGFPKGSLIILAGNPGSGKTSFSSNFLCKGVDSGEAGLYVSFAENEETFITNMSEHFHRDCGICSKKGLCTFLDLVSLKEGGAPAVLKSILEKAEETAARRLVIDSFSAMAQTFKEKIDTLNVLHTILAKLVRQFECTTILVVETPYGQEQIGTGIEEIAADGVIKLSRSTLDGRLLRNLEIMKLGGTRLTEREFIFTLEGGFRIFLPSSTKPVEKPQRFKPIRDQPGKFSSGSEDLDNLLGGGYAVGSTLLIEVGENVSIPQYQSILAPTGWNFMAQKRGGIVIPSAGVDYDSMISAFLQGGFTEEEISRYARVGVIRSSEEPATPSMIPVEGKNSTLDYLQLIDVEKELTTETGKPIILLFGYDSLIAHYGVGATMEIANSQATRVREKGNLGIGIVKPGYEDASKILASMANVHLKIVREHGVVIIYGIKPRTKLYVLETDTSKGYHLPKLTPIL